MIRSVTVFCVLLALTFSSAVFAQALDQGGISTLRPQKPDARVLIDYLVGDSSVLNDLIDFQRLQFRFEPLEYPMLDTPIVASDSTSDTTIFEISSRIKRWLGQKDFSFIIPDPPSERLVSYIEPFSMLDFNRVNGFFLGIGRTRYYNYGRYDEFGVKGGIGYGFEDKKGQNFIGAEYRIPLESVQSGNNEPAHRMFRATPTLALGAEYHNITSTEDYWRAGRIENATYAFFAREDFRDYFKMKGWAAHLAYRPKRIMEARVEFRSDEYFSKPQLVYRGRWGGNKVLPVNPEITEGRMNSFVGTFHYEDAFQEGVSTKDVFGDNVTMNIMKGRAYMFQVEFGNQTQLDSSFIRYILDVRNFTPIIEGLNFDTRLRYEASSGAAPLQKLQYLGGPSTLPAYKNKVFAGNRMILLNTELRLNLALLSGIFGADDAQLLLKNDFGFLTNAPENSPFSGLGDFEFGKVIYNIGIGLGSTEGGELGVSWRTDISESPRFFIRWNRPF